VAGETGDTLARMERDGWIAWLALVASVVTTCVTAYLILLPSGRPALVAAAACVTLTVASIAARSDLLRFLGAIAYRAFDGLVLGSIAWVVRTTMPFAAVAALLALAGGFLASYFSARGTALGYGIDGSAANRFFRTGLVAIALWSPRGDRWMVALAVFSLLTALVRASQAFKEERAS